MDENKLEVLKLRPRALALSILFGILSIILITASIIFSIYSNGAMFITVILSCFVVVGFSVALLYYFSIRNIKLYEYTIEDNKIEAYSSLYMHTLYLNGEVVDEYVGDFNLTRVELTYKDEGLDIYMSITPLNKCRLLVNESEIKRTEYKELRS